MRKISLTPWFFAFGVGFINLGCEDTITEDPEDAVIISCSDGIKNGSETDIDCGGDCAPCNHRQSCKRSQDCSSNVCNNGTCDCTELELEIKGQCVENLCLNAPCQNGGECTVTGRNQYRCDCQEGYFGVNCTSQNPCDNDPCQNDGICQNSPSSADLYFCKCPDGFYGPTCAQTCPASSTCESVVTCAQSTGLPTDCASCIDGYYGQACNLPCETDPKDLCIKPASCNQSTGKREKCAECQHYNAEKGQSARWGSQCENVCPNSADDSNIHCKTVLTCDMNTGAPITCDGCEDGYYGEDCSKTCPIDTYCTEVEACLQGSGRATKCRGCPNGYAGENCAEACPIPEKMHCAGTVICSQNSESGSATLCTECQTGYFGESCNQTCTDSNPYWNEQNHCLDLPSVTCDKDGSNVKCEKGCQEGYRGIDCSDPCPKQKNCLDEALLTCDQNNPNGQSVCKSRITCDPISINEGSVEGSSQSTACEHRPSACKDGYWGPSCEKECNSRKDEFKCTNITKCEQDDGTPIECQGDAENPLACQSGYFGPTCEQICAISSSCNEGATQCGQDTGVFENCTSCKDGRYGEQCNLLCPTFAPSWSPTASCTPGGENDLRCLQCDVLPFTENAGEGEWVQKGCIDIAVQGEERCDNTSDPSFSCYSCLPPEDNNSPITTCEPISWCQASTTASSKRCLKCPKITLCKEIIGEGKACVTPSTQGSDAYQFTTQCYQMERNAGSSESSISHCINVAQCDQKTGAPNQCANCLDGWWGEDCRYACRSSDQCDKVQSCDKQTGVPVLCDGCKNSKFYGNACEHDCTELTTSSNPNCLSISLCTQDGTPTACAGCDTNYYTDDCSKKCPSPPNCNVTEGSTITCTQRTGVTTACSSCVDGYYGDKCERPCSSYRPEGEAQMHCSKITRCQKEATVNENNIVIPAGLPLDCNECEDGYSGPTCSTPCKGRTQCKVVKCNKENENHVESCPVCIRGFYSNPDHVREALENPNSIFYQNYHDDPYCRDRCVTEESDTHCLPNTIHCDLNTGELTGCYYDDGQPAGTHSPCQSGYYGTTCDNTCVKHERCAGNNFECVVLNEGTQTSLEYYCNSGCITGYWKDNCNTTCANSSETHCKVTDEAGNRYITCSQQTGAILSCTSPNGQEDSACENKYTGELCKDVCQPPNKKYCRYEEKCDPINTQCKPGENGFCKDCDYIPDYSCTQSDKDEAVLSCSPCVDGHWGVLCEEDCQNEHKEDDPSVEITHCKDPTQSNKVIICNQADGKVIDCGECQDGYYSDKESQNKDCRGECFRQLTEANHCKDPTDPDVVKVKCNYDETSTELQLYCNQDCEQGWWDHACDKACSNQVDGQILTHCADETSSICNKESREATASAAAIIGGQITACGESAGCIDGWWGDACDKDCDPTAILHCQKSETTEGPEVRYYKCDRDGHNTECTFCTKGWYGNQCNIQCKNQVGDHPTYCTETALQTAVCDRDAAEHFTTDGTIFSCEACEPGWYGKNCQDKCETLNSNDVRNCTTDNEDSVTCDHDGHNPVCKACNPGYWGTTCKSICENTTADNATAAHPVTHCRAPANSTCVKDTGFISACSTDGENEGCAPGYYGTDCSLPCQNQPADQEFLGTHCTADALKSAICDRDSNGNFNSAGTISRCSTCENCNACDPGWYGQTCSEPCQNSGATHCTAEALTSAICTGGELASCNACEPGWYGPTCESKCIDVIIAQNGEGPNFCLTEGQPISSITCVQTENGISIESCEECVTGKHGPTCTTDCQLPDNHHCSKDAQIDCSGEDENYQVTCSQCNTGYYGNDCSQDCVSALSNQYTEDNNHCITTDTEGNTTLYSSVACSKENGDNFVCEQCAPGYGGNDCQKACANAEGEGATHCVNPAIANCKDKADGTNCGEGTSCQIIACGAEDSCTGSAWYGTACETPCTAIENHQCLSLGTNATCTRDGKITNCGTDAESHPIGCNPGRYGDDCESQCQAIPNIQTEYHCAELSLDTTCDKEGSQIIECKGACEAGYYGLNCHNACKDVIAANDYEGPNHCVTDGEANSVTCSQKDDESISIDTCEACADGYWDQLVNTPCTVPCENIPVGVEGHSATHCASPNHSACGKTDGYITACSTSDGCAPGWFDALCSSPCQNGANNHCTDAALASATCDRDTTGKFSTTGDITSCDSCIDGWYGNACSEACPAPTATQHCAADELDGDTTVHHYACEGETEGWHCTVCADGYWDTDCSQACEKPDHCSEASIVTCSKDGGLALKCTLPEGNACKDGWYGDTCEIACENAADQHCAHPENSACDQTSGLIAACTEGCEDGWFGSDCKAKCNSQEGYAHCIKCSGTITDGEVSDFSCEACEDGYKGSNCNDTCLSSNQEERASQLTTLNGEHPHCSTDNNITWSCDQNGTFTDCSACQPGYYGTFCNEGCSNTQGGTHCQDESTSICAKDTGAISACSTDNGGIPQCADGYYGEKCTSECAGAPAIENDVDLTRCDRTEITNVSCYQNGTDVPVTITRCIACEAGYFGILCEQNCSDHLPGSSNCDPGATISCSENGGQVTITSCAACKPGYWGTTCTNTCDQSCTTCTGTGTDIATSSDYACTSCADGYYLNGTECTECEEKCKKCEETADNCTECSNGLWGETCDDPCVNSDDTHCFHPESSICNKDTGEITACSTDGCVDGYAGETCNETCLDKNPGHHCAEGAIVFCAPNGSNLNCTNCEPGYCGMNCNNTGGDNCTACTVISGRSSCISCSDGYFVNTVGSYGSCASCPSVNHCATCSNGNSCNTCQAGYYKGGNSQTCNQNCSNINHCVTGHITCTTASDQTCDQCDTGYYVNSSGKCSSCQGISNCANGHVTCTKWGNSICDQCDTGYYVNSSGKCTSCNSISNCAIGHLSCTTASDQTCDQCQYPYTLSPDHKSCTWNW